VRIDPVLAALRAQPGRLAGECAAIESAWKSAQAHGPARGLLEQLASHGKGEPIRTLPLLSRMMTAGAGAANLLAPVIRAMRDAPLGQLRLPHFAGPVTQSLTLAIRGRSALSIAVLDADAWRHAGGDKTGRVAFQGGELDLVVMAGSGLGRIIVRRGGVPGAEPVELRAGHALSLDCARQALVFDRLDGASLVLLRLFRKPESPGTVEEIAISSGEVMHRAAGRQSQSRMEMAMALLGRMGRADAAPVMAEVAREGEPALRWQALRECLALDAFAGFAALLDVAGDPVDALAPPARKLADELAARHRALAALREGRLCPA